MNEIKSKNKATCPKCGKEAIVKTMWSQLLYGAVICILSFGVSLWIPIIGWICSPIFIIIGGILFLSSILAFIQGSAIMECEECKSKFNISKSEYKKMKSK